MDGFPLVPYVLAVFPASSFPLGIPDLAVVQLYFCGIFSRYFSDTGGFAFEVQLSLTEKGQYAVAYDLSCKKDCHEL
ncbi:hypothetical protein, partial [Neisseria meningitidis]|uniref:hypothetical protein n=1 Tax=Neisseria meningitidis TaxID=487 RepID=UPI001E5554A8